MAAMKAAAQPAVTVCTAAPGAAVPDSSLAIWARDPAAAATNATGTRTSISRLTGLRA
jgi:hypothetical protein